ncbi:MAG: resuscitation-promoting factor RpfB [Eubacteriaceae bacterium]|nr:resuscitation-promoting factor RpfB [Eubacteriaceae bacterium]
MKISTKKFGDAGKMALKAVTTGILTSSLIGVTGSFVLAKEVTVSVDDQQTVVSGNLFENVGSVLASHGIEVGDDYTLNVDSDTFLVVVDEIEVARKSTGKLMVDDEIINYETGAQTVGDLLEEEGIVLGELDRVEPSKDELLADTSQVKVIRVTVGELPGKVSIPYNTIEQENPNLTVGTRQVTQAGVNGSKTIVERVLFENNEEVLRVTSSEIVSKEAVDEIVQVGTKAVEVKPVETAPVVEAETTQTTPAPVETPVETKPVETPAPVTPTESNVTNNNTQTTGIPEGAVKMTLNCTAYTATGNATASGVMPQANHTIAAWSGLPFGTKVYIPALNTTFTVEDRGGAVTQGIIDIYMDSYEECIQFGRQNLEAYVVYP